MSGDSHSIVATRGRGRPRVRSAIAAMRSRRRATSRRPRSGAPRAAATRSMSAKTSARLAGLSGVSLGGSPTHPESAASTSVERDGADLALHLRHDVRRSELRSRSASTR